VYALTATQDDFPSKLRTQVYRDVLVLIGCKNQLLNASFLWYNGYNDCYESLA
jgi:hypothetical protein